MMDEIHGSQVSIMGEQNSRLTEVTRRHDMVMSRMSDELCDLKRIVKNLEGGNNRQLGEGGSRSTQPMKLDLPLFSGEDP